MGGLWRKSGLFTMTGAYHVGQAHDFVRLNTVPNLKNFGSAWNLKPIKVGGINSIKVGESLWVELLPQLAINTIGGALFVVSQGEKVT